MINEYLSEITTVIVIATIMVISPGQDFAMITRNSLLYSRRSGLIGAFGIFVAIWLHVGYSLAGIAVIISQSPWLYNTIKYAGAAYLIYLGLTLILSKSKLINNNLNLGRASISDLSSFKSGFLSNALNPKTTLFFLSIFTQVVNQHTPFNIQILFGFIIAIAHIIWFSIVACFFSSKALQSRVDNIKPWIEKIMGGCLCLLAAKLIL